MILEVIPLLAHGEMGEAGFYIVLFLLLIGLALAAGMIAAVGVWVARRHRGKATPGRVLLGSVGGGLLAGAVACGAVFPLRNLPGGWLWVYGVPLSAVGLGAWLGASLAIARTAESCAAAFVLAVLLFVAFPAAQFATYLHYRQPSIDEAIERVEAGDATVLRHLPTYQKKKPAIVTALIASLDRFPESQRPAAVRMLGDVGQGDKLATEALVDVLRNHPSADCRYAAGVALVKFAPPDSPQLVPALLAAVEDADPQVRRQAIYALKRLRPPADQVVPQLVASYAHGDATDRRLIEELLLEIDPQGAVFAPAVRAALDAYPEDVRRDAQRLLTKTGQAAQGGGDEDRE